YGAMSAAATAHLIQAFEVGKPIEGRDSILAPFDSIFQLQHVGDADIPQIDLHDASSCRLADRRWSRIHANSPCKACTPGEFRLLTAHAGISTIGVVGLRQSETTCPARRRLHPGSRKG